MDLPLHKRAFVPGMADTFLPSCALRGSLSSDHRQLQAIAKQAQMPLRGSGGDESGRLTLEARVTSCPASAIF